LENHTTIDRGQAREGIIPGTVVCIPKLTILLRAEEEARGGDLGGLRYSTEKGAQGGSGVVWDLCRVEGNETPLKTRKIGNERMQADTFVVHRDFPNTSRLPKRKLEGRKMVIAKAEGDRKGEHAKKNFRTIKKARRKENTSRTID